GFPGRSRCRHRLSQPVDEGRPHGRSAALEVRDRARVELRPPPCGRASHARRVERLPALHSAGARHDPDRVDGGVHLQHRAARQEPATGVADPRGAGLVVRAFDRNEPLSGRAMAACVPAMVPLRLRHEISRTPGRAPTGPPSSGGPGLTPHDPMTRDEAAAGRVRLGIIGARFAADVQAPAFRRDDRCELTGIASANPDRAARAAARLGDITVHEDWRRLIADDRTDAIAVAVPPAIQPRIAIDALACGKPVFAEKPMALTAALAAQMRDAATTAGVANMVDFAFVGIPSWREAKARLDAGAIGRLRHVAVTWNVETRANV